MEDYGAYKNNSSDYRKNNELGRAVSNNQYGLIADLGGSKSFSGLVKTYRKIQRLFPINIYPRVKDVIDISTISVSTGWKKIGIFEMYKKDILVENDQGTAKLYIEAGTGVTEIGSVGKNQNRENTITLWSTRFPDGFAPFTEISHIEFSSSQTFNRVLNYIHTGKLSDK